MAKKLIVGQAQWGIDDQQAHDIVKQVREAMQTGGSVELPLLNGEGKPITVFLNGKATPTATIELDDDPRPSEMA